MYIHKIAYYVILIIAEELLNHFGQQLDSWRHCLFFLGNTNNEYVMMYCMTVLEVYMISLIFNCLRLFTIFLSLTCFEIVLSDCLAESCTLKMFWLLFDDCPGFFWVYELPTKDSMYFAYILGSRLLGWMCVNSI